MNAKQNTGRNTLRNQVLAERRLKLVPNGKLGYIKVGNYTVKKTEKMKNLEHEHGADIRDLISKGSVRRVARRLGVHPSIISRWRDTLQIED